jgi:threonine/homoserine/homoserine lactone efflux protein
MFVVTLTAGVVFGLSAGFSPGPLLTFLISQTLRYGTREGIKVAIAPLLTDLPIILLTVFLLTRLAHYQTLLGLLSLIGGLFVLYLAYQTFRTGKLETDVQEIKCGSLSRGVIVNFLNPHPYLFWLSVGAPTMVKAWAEDRFSAIAFVTSFYLCLIGSKVFLAILAGNSRRLVTGKAYTYLMRFLGILLLIFSIFLLRDGLILLGL